MLACLSQHAPQRAFSSVIQPGQGPALGTLVSPGALWSKRVGGLIASALGAAIGWQLMQQQRQADSLVRHSEPDFTTAPPCHPHIGRAERESALASMTAWLESQGADVTAVDFAACQVSFSPVQRCTVTAWYGWQ